MCTLSWCAAPGSPDGSYQVLFNRDERVERRAEGEPRQLVLRGAGVLATHDREAHGAWITTNAFGLTLAVLNGYLGADEHAAREPRSRGLLLLELAPSQDLVQLEQHARAALEASAYRSFVLVGFAPGGAPRELSWDGARLAARELTPDDRPLVSSAHDAPGARVARRALLEAMARAHGGVDAELLAAFHASHEPARGPLSPCMHRDDARTRSLVRVEVGARDVSLTWRPGPPCEAASDRGGASGPRGGGAVALRLPRAAPSALDAES